MKRNTGTTDFIWENSGLKNEFWGDEQNIADGDDCAPLNKYETFSGGVKIGIESTSCNEMWPGICVKRT